MRRPPESDDATVVLRRPAPAHPARRRSPRAAWLAAAVLLAAALGAAGLWLWQEREQPATLLPATLPPAAQAPPETRPAASPAPPQPTPARHAARLASPAEILAHRGDGLGIFRVSGNSAIVVLDFPTLTEQGRMLNRIAALVEKAGLPRDRVLDDKALAAAITSRGETVETFYLGHNYRARDLARFFSLAAAQGLGLNAEERRLAAILADLGILARGADGTLAVVAEAAIVTVPAIQPENGEIGLGFAIDASVREAILRHELSHGEFFTNKAYHDHVATWWHQRLSARERTRFRQFLAEGGYDPDLEEVMMNEAMAYLIHTPDARFFSAEAVGMDAATLDRLRARFLEGLPDTWLHREAWPGGR
jgi:hypothetical protein